VGSHESTAPAHTGGLSATNGEQPGVGEVIVAEEDLRRRVAELGAQITKDYAGCAA